MKYWSSIVVVVGVVVVEELEEHMMSILVPERGCVPGIGQG